MAEYLSLAAAPLFAAMAALTALQGDAMGHMLCMGSSWLAGMAPMYGLMAVVHLAPWLRLARR